MDRLNKNNENLNKKLNDLKKNFNIELEKKLNGKKKNQTRKIISNKFLNVLSIVFCFVLEIIETDMFERESRLVNIQQTLYEAKLENRFRTNSRLISEQKNELLNRLFNADSSKEIEDVGKCLVRNIDDSIANNDESSIKTQNKYLFKKLDQLQRENERYTIISFRKF